MWRDLLARGRNTVSRLFSDKAGNVLIMTAAFMIPMLALIGSSVDLGRVYVARSRMQQACDAASLAGRWAYGQSKLTDTASTEAIKFFNADFPQGSFGTKPFIPLVTITGTNTKIVNVSASTTLDMSIMAMFGFQSMVVATQCSAQQDYVNTDIVLVLDGSGSMNDKAVSTDTVSKIAGLRTAVLALYTQLAPIQAQLTAAGMRMRLGIVPYSSAVNVGKLVYAVNPAYIRNPSDYQMKGTAPTPTSVKHDADWFTKTWNGCIEERQTNSTITTTTSAIPSDAYDLDIDRIPTDDPSRWPAYDPASETGTSANYCPAPAQRLQWWAQSDLETYVASLQANGSTYHDIGMIWGARLLSSGGIFADSPDLYNGMPTNRFIIFMTDGATAPTPTVYSSYGIEQYDKRITGTAGATVANQTARHNQRLSLMCSALKNRGVSIWVVAFAATPSSNLVNCASNAGQVSVSTSSADLISKFTQIGKAIGAMRLSK